MKKYQFIPIFIFSFLISCSALKKNQSSGNTKNLVESSNNIALKVSFISIGQGINFEASKYFPSVIEKFNKEKKVKLKYEIIPWGREGEFNYCFNEQPKIKEFIIFAKKEMAKYENVEFHENPLNCNR